MNTAHPHLQSAKIILMHLNCQIVFEFTNTAIVILNFLYCSPYSFISSNFAIAKDFGLNLFVSLPLFCIALSEVIDLPTIATSKVVALLQAIAKSKGKTIDSYLAF